MHHTLGVDLGTTFTAAALHRPARGGLEAAVETLTLGNRAPAMPSVVFTGPATETLVGEAAARRQLQDPDHVVREFKRRVGDPVPLLVGGAPFSAERLMADVLAHVLDVARRHTGAAARVVALTHPANWGEYKLDLLRQAARMADAGDAVLLAEPVAAATAYAAQAELAEGAVVAVYDLGGGTFDASVLRRVGAGFELLGTPEGVERLGGIDIDEAVFRLVLGHLQDDLAGVDLADPSLTADLVRLRSACVEAKEALSFDTDAAVSAPVGTVRAEVRITREELERISRPLIEQTVAAMRRALRSAEVTGAELDRVLLVGGASRMPLVAETVGAALGRPVTVDADPKHVVARGAALAAAALGDGPGDGAGSVRTIPSAAPSAPSTTGEVRQASTPVGSAPHVVPSPHPAPDGMRSPDAPAATVRHAGDARPDGSLVGGAPADGSRAGGGRLVGAVLGLVALAVIAVGLVLALRGGEDPETAQGGAATPATAADVAAGQGQAVVLAEGPADCPAAPSICLRRAQVVDDVMLVEFTTAGIALQPGQEPHARFFFADAPSSTVRWQSPDPFGTGGRGFTRAESASRQLCAVLAQGDRAVPDSGSCIIIP